MIANPSLGEPRFELGKCVMTCGIRAEMEERYAVPQLAALGFLKRHASGDWGDVDSHDASANELALEQDLRIFSVYHLAPTEGERNAGAERGPKVWVITEADRSSTTLLLPEEY